MVKQMLRLTQIVEFHAINILLSAGFGRFLSEYSEKEITIMDPVKIKITICNGCHSLIRNIC